MNIYSRKEVLGFCKDILGEHQYRTFIMSSFSSRRIAEIAARKAFMEQLSNPSVFHLRKALEELDNGGKWD